MATSTLTDRRYQPDDPSAALADATAALVAAFDDIAYDPEMPGCPHCVDRFDRATLGADVRRVAPEALARFAIKAGTTWGSPDDLRRLVPALLPLMADHQLAVDPQVVWWKLRWAGWPEWPSTQVAAVHGFLLAEWGRLLRAQPRPAHAAHGWLAQVATGVDDLEPFLVAWHDALGPLNPPPYRAAAVGHLATLLLDSPLRPDIPATIADAFPGRPQAARQVAAWLAGPGTTHELQLAARELSQTPMGRRVGLASERLRRFVAASQPD